MKILDHLSVLPNAVSVNPMADTGCQELLGRIQPH